MKMLKYYLFFTLLLGALTVFSFFSWLTLPLLWFTVSLSLVSYAYAANNPFIFRKHGTGKIPSFAKWLFWPYLMGSHLYNAFARSRDNQDTFHAISDDLFVACRLFPSDVDMLKSQGIESILDVTAEFDGLNWSAEQQGLHYLNIPVLDHQVPSQAQLAHGIAWLEIQHKLQRKVVVHCALGRGRSVLFCVAYMLYVNKQMTLRTALERIQSKREKARLNKHQLKGLSQFHHDDAFNHDKTLTLVVNPASGANAWSRYENEILAELTLGYRIEIAMTKKDESICDIVRKIVEETKPDVVVAVGGDGTVAGVANAINGLSFPMGIIPLGTANSVATAIFGAPVQFDPISKPCASILSGNTTSLDCMQCNSELSLLAIAVGFEQKMIEKAHRKKKNDSGQIAYLKGLFEAISENTPIDCKISVDGGEFEEVQCVSLVVANAAPKTSILAQGNGTPKFDDGKLDVTILPRHTDDNIGLTMSELLMPTPNLSDKIIAYQCKKITIEFEVAQSFSIDGELKTAEQLEIKIIPAGIKLLSL
ncbi:diacylglycerol kinase family protein [Pseudoalteromonas sp. T1lg65]|uniref:diacylglycerol kinase family protein n=1 Tax=Pseudoalteromonas sp. T1lg65 TaxID=2077101 RepID=UPI003F78D367